MKTSYACLAISAGIVMYVWAAVTAHYLHLQNDKTSIMAAGLVAIVFAIFGLMLLPF